MRGRNSEYEQLETFGIDVRADGSFAKMFSERYYLHVLRTRCTNASFECGTNEFQIRAIILIALQNLSE